MTLVIALVTLAFVCLMRPNWVITVTPRKPPRHLRLKGQHNAEASKYILSDPDEYYPIALYEVGSLT